MNEHLTAPALAEGKICFRPAPEREPPFDDELPDSGSSLVLPVQRPLPFVSGQPPVRHRPAVTSRSARRIAVGDPELWSRRLLVGVLEVASGRRALIQLTPLLSPSVAVGLRADLADALNRRHWLRSARLRSVRVTEPVDGVAELCATLHTSSEAHAVALRLEIRRGRWICTKFMLA